MKKLIAILIGLLLTAIAFAGIGYPPPFNSQTGYWLKNKLLFSSTAPTIASGFGTSPSIVSSNGTAVFLVNVGTGGTASSGTITMPIGSGNSWACHAEFTNVMQANSAMWISGSGSTSVTIQNYAVSTGANLAWPASQTLRVFCLQD